MPRKSAREVLASLDRDELERFQSGIRKRYSDEEIIEQLLDCARRLGRSPSMREFSADPETSVHPQTVIEHFGSWNAAKRAAGLVPRRFATREELLRLLKELGETLGRTPTARDLDEHRGSMPSKSLDRQLPTASSRGASRRGTSVFPPRSTKSAGSPPSRTT